MIFLTIIIIIVAIISVYFLVLLPLGLVIGFGQDAAASRKYKKFYDECLERGITKPDIKDKDKIAVIAQKHNVPNGYATFEQIYRQKNKPGMSAEQKRKYIISLCVGTVIGLAIALIISMTVLDHIDLTLILLLPLCGAVIGVLVYHLSKPFTQNKNS